ncbi:HTTM domain-containing protein [Kitasatospora sp. NPDC085879]|uniref:HTTM domain-containing protein n=1 Tax=Kitasatospora sp. NPDC085879 TaxID=3154769 RepID=UPI003439A67E
MTADPRHDPVTRAFAFLTERAVSLRAAALLRIGYGLLYLTFLLREFPHRDEIWGPGSPWTPELARELQAQNGEFTLLTLSDSSTWFEACYVLALVTSALFALGWHTRAVSVLFALVVTSFHSRAVLMTDGGDNLIALMAVYLALTACGRRWSLDSRRARSARPASGPVHPWRRYAEPVRSRVAVLLHNCGMFVIAAQVCILYGSAGLSKVQGSLWRDGTALHYALHLDLFRPWPALSAQADSHPLLLTAVCYLTVVVQVAFPFTLFSKVKYTALAVLLGMHLGIALLLGLPLFSFAMITADAVFLPDALLLRLGRAAQASVRRATPRTPIPAPTPPALNTPAPRIPEGH